MPTRRGPSGDWVMGEDVLTSHTEYSVPKPPGLPEGYIFHDLRYNPVAGMLVATVRTGMTRDTVFRIYARLLADRHYRELPYDEGAAFSYRGVVSAVERPLIFFNQWRSRGDGAFDWAALVRCNLSEWTVEPIVTDRFGGGTDDRRWWISNLISSDSVGRRVSCVVGREAPTPEGSLVDYSFETLDTTDRTFTAHCVLEGVFL